MKGKLELSIVIPAYAEEENLNILLPRIVNTVKNFEDNFEVLVIDTVSPLDFTKDVCVKNGAIYINRSVENSFGSALRTGINNSKGKYIIFMDADGSHSPEFISELYEKRSDNCVVIASRYTEGGNTDDKKSLVWMSKILNWSYCFALRLKIKDISNSFKLYDKALLKNVELKCKNTDIVEEIIYKIIRQNDNVNIIELPYSFKKRMFGQTKRIFLIKHIFLYAITLFRFVLKDLRFKLDNRGLIKGSN